MEGMERYRMESAVMPGEGDSEIWVRSPEEPSGVVENGMR
jgi:hypothetical protein